VEKRSLYLALLSTSHGMNHVYQLLIPVVIPRITADYELSNFSAGVLLSCFSLSYSLLQAPFGYLSRIYGRKILLVLGFIMTSLSFLAIGFVENIMMLSLLFFLAGIGGSTYHPNGMPFLSEFYEENRGQASGFHQTGGASGSFIAPLAIGALLALLGLDWRLTVTTLSIPGIILVIALWSLLVEPKRKIGEKESEQQFKGNMRVNLRPYGPSLIFIVAAMIYVVGLRGIDAFANQYFTYGRETKNIAEASFLFSMLKVAGLFSGPLSGKFSDIFGRKKVLIVLVVVESVSLYTLTIVPLTILIVPCIVFGFGSFGLLAITDAFLADITPKEHMATIFGLNFTVSFMTSAIIPPILGGIIDLYGFGVGFMTLSAIMPFSIPILLQIKSKGSTAKDKS